VCPRTRHGGRRGGVRRFARTTAGGLSSRLPPRTLRQTTDTALRAGAAAPPRPPTPRVPPDRPPRRVVGNSCLVLRRSAAAPSLRARGFALRHHPGVADADHGDARSRPEPSPPAPPARPAATPAPRHPALRVASWCGQFLPGVAPSCASPGTRGPGFGAAAPARSCRHECVTTRAHDARRTSARRTSPRHGHDATCTSALPSHAPGTQAQAVVGGGSLSRRGRPGGRSRDRPVDRRGPTGPPRRAARRGAARPPARPVGRGRRCGRCGTASRRAPPPTAT